MRAFYYGYFSIVDAAHPELAGLEAFAPRRSRGAPGKASRAAAAEIPAAARKWTRRSRSRKRRSGAR
jgi:hypothetical protein